MKKLIISLGFLVVALAITLIAFMPTIKRGQKINELQALQDKRAECEEFQKNSHLEAESIRKELGLPLESQQPSKSGELLSGQAMQLLNQYIEGTATEELNQ